MHVGDTAGEKEFDVAIQMTLIQVSSEIQKKKQKMGDKSNLYQRNVNVTKRYKCYKLPWKSVLAESLF